MPGLNKGTTGLYGGSPGLNEGALGLYSGAAGLQAGSGVLNVDFGEFTRQGYGGYPTGAAPGSTITGTGASNFSIDASGHLVPAGTYGAALWSRTGSSPYTLTLANGQVVVVTIIPNAATVRPLRVTDQMPQNQAAFSDAITNNINTIYWRSGDYNTDGQLVYASMSGTIPRTVTIRSDVSDSSTARQHGCRIGMLYFNYIPSNITFRDIWWYRDSATPGTGNFVQTDQNVLNQGSASFYNCRFENTALVPLPPSNYGALNLGAGGTGGATTVDGNLFINMGQAAISVSNDVVTPTISNNIFKTPKNDCINPSVAGAILTSNYGNSLAVSGGAHADFLQPGTIATSGNGGTFTKNLWNRAVTTPAADSSPEFFFETAYTAGQKRQNAIRNNNIYFGNNAVFINAYNYDDPVIRYNTGLNDPTQDGGNNTVCIALTGGNNATITHNVMNAAAQVTGGALGNQTGTITQDHNVLINYTDLAALTVAFPNVPQTFAASKLILTRAQLLLAMTPANTLTTSGGVVHGDGQVAGALFPATPGQTIGAWNDGTAYQPLDAPWVAAHPPAT